MKSLFPRQLSLNCPRGYASASVKKKKKKNSLDLHHRQKKKAGKKEKNVVGRGNFFFFVFSKNIGKFPHGQTMVRKCAYFRR